MSEMIDRVAVTLDRVAFMPAAYGEGFALRREAAREKARAAIEAMRDPTEAMLIRGKRQPNDLREIWRAMIDTALNSNRGEQHERGNGN